MLCFSLPWMAGELEYGVFSIGPYCMGARLCFVFHSRVWLGN
jgi:hypothetical protein